MTAPLMTVCRYECEEKSKIERGLASEARQSEQPNFGLSCTRIDILSLTRFFFKDSNLNKFNLDRLSKRMATPNLVK